MKILSIDVGIKNLAYCLFSVKNNTYEIDCWDVIDICESEDKKYCIEPKCTKLAKFHRDELCYCKVHAKKRRYIIPTSKDTKKAINKLKLDGLVKYCKERMIITENCKLKKDYIGVLEEFIDKKFFYQIDGKNANNMTLVELGINLQKRFDSKLLNHDIDCVIIENQISPIANRMKTLQGMIAQYFIMRDVHCIEFVSASNKLKKHMKNKKSSYSERKKMSIELVKAQFESNIKIEKWNDLFIKHTKKDDLADCFLQGIWYLEDKNML